MARLLWIVLLIAADLPAQLRFAILGDRTGGANQTIYTRVWSEVAKEKPAFAINVGDTIEGLVDARAASEWAMLSPIWAKYANMPLYFTPGNHDIWSPISEKIYREQTGHAASYGFTFHNQVHITVLDNGRTNSLSEEQLQFLERDLKAAPAGVPRLIFFHVPFWIVPLSFQSGAFELHQIAQQYGVAAVVSGHTHQFLKVERDGIQYYDAGSSGASLQRGFSSGQGAAEGWFYGWTLCTIRGMQVQLEQRKLPSVSQ